MTKIKLELPGGILDFASECAKDGFTLYVVGGVCRDAILGIKRKSFEYDLSGPMSAEEAEKAAERAGFFIVSEYKRIGTVKAKKGDVSAEFTSFRSDSYALGHRPEEVYFTTDIEKDAQRRDFTFNAVYYDILAEKFVDPLGGIFDIEKRTCRTTRPPADVFSEDGLRLMRLSRISSEIGFDIDPGTMKGARENAGMISGIAKERIWAELDDILHADEKYGVEGAHYKGVMTLWESGVLEKILPELTKGDGMSQPPRYHKYDVLQHSLRCVLYAAPSVRLAALLHDVGKPACATGDGHFYGHENAGVDIAAEILRRLKVSNEETRKVKFLVRYHMYDSDCRTSEKKIRRFIIENLKYFDDILAIKQADFSACADDTSEAPTVTKWKKIYTAMKKEGVPMSLKELAVKGYDLIDAGVTPKNVGRILSAMLRECAAGTLENDRGRLIARALCAEKELR